MAVAWDISARAGMTFGPLDVNFCAAFLAATRERTQSLRWRTTLPRAHATTHRPRAATPEQDGRTSAPEALRGNLAASRKRTVGMTALLQLDLCCKAFDYMRYLVRWRMDFLFSQDGGRVGPIRASQADCQTCLSEFGLPTTHCFDVHAPDLAREESRLTQGGRLAESLRMHKVTRGMWL